MRVRFLADAEIRDGAGIVTESYRAGEVHDLRIDKARRWIAREKAEPATDETPPAAAPAAEPVTEAPATFPAAPPAEAAPKEPARRGRRPARDFAAAQEAYRAKALKADD